MEAAGIEPASENHPQKRLHACSADLISLCYLPSGQASNSASLSVVSPQRPEARRAANLLYDVGTAPCRSGAGHANGV